MPLKKSFNKDRAKRLARGCLFCGENDLNLLDVHRIVEGSQGGEYNQRNSLVVCAVCHRKCHSGRIVIEGKYFSTSGMWKVFYTEDGIDKVVETIS